MILVLGSKTFYFTLHKTLGISHCITSHGQKTGKTENLDGSFDTEEYMRLAFNLRSNLHSVWMNSQFPFLFSSCLQNHFGSSSNSYL